MRIKKSYTIDEEITAKIQAAAAAEERSESFIANRILGDYFSKKEAVNNGGRD